MTETQELPDFINAYNDNDEFVTVELKGVPLTNQIERDKVTTRRFRVLDTYQIADGVQFDGIDDRLNCGNHNTLWSQGLTKFSWSIWIYGFSGLGDRYIDHGWVNGNESHIFVCYGGNQGLSLPPSWIINTSGGSNRVASGDFIDNNKWNNILGTYDSTLASANIKIYVNAVLGSVTGNLTETINSSHDLTIGHPVALPFHGYTKDFRFWATEALTAQNALDIYGTYAEDQSLEEPNIPTPDYWLPMNEGVGTPIDTIGDKTTTFSNGATWLNPANYIRIKYGDEEDVPAEGDSGEAVVVGKRINEGFKDIRVDDDTYDYIISLMP